MKRATIVGICAASVAAAAIVQYRESNRKVRLSSPGKRVVILVADLADSQRHQN
jgi:hypothetical protein